MFNLSDRVRHKLTGDIGLVVGYGHKMVKNNYLTTIKVLITRSSLKDTSIRLILEDLWEQWEICQGDKTAKFYFSQGLSYL